MASRSKRSDVSNDNLTDIGIVAAQKSDVKVKDQRGKEHKLKKILTLSPDMSPSSTPEPVRWTSGSNISVTEDDKTEQQDLTEQAKWADHPILRSSEYISSTPRNSTQTKVSTSPPLHVHVTDQYRPVTRRGQDYNLVSFWLVYIYFYMTKVHMYMFMSTCLPI